MSEELYRNRQNAYYTPYLEKFGAISGPLLDMGCGHGHLLDLAKQTKNIEVHGVDGSKNRVKICKDKGLNVIFHNLCDKLPYEGNYFQAIYCGQVLEHIPKHGQINVVKEAFRLLKINGIFQIRSPNRNNEASRKPGHEYLLTMSELKTLLLDAGFRNLDFSINYPQKIPEMPDYITKLIWKLFKPDILAASASAIAYKR
jgi:2-polyprenyl-3-methyl-5-hydroxy-6-metoxy-1,4-benzoquinol methylase